MELFARIAPLSGWVRHTSLPFRQLRKNVKLRLNEIRKGQQLHHPAGGCFTFLTSVGVLQMLHFPHVSGGASNASPSPRQWGCFKCFTFPTSVGVCTKPPKGGFVVSGVRITETLLNCPVQTSPPRWAFCCRLETNTQATGKPVTARLALLSSGGMHEGSPQNSEKIVR